MMPVHADLRAVAAGPSSLKVTWTAGARQQLQRITSYDLEYKARRVQLIGSPPSFPIALATA